MEPDLSNFCPKILNSNMNFSCKCVSSLIAYSSFSVFLIFCEDVQIKVIASYLRQFHHSYNGKVRGRSGLYIRPSTSATTSTESVPPFWEKICSHRLDDNKKLLWSAVNSEGTVRQL